MNSELERAIETTLETQSGQKSRIVSHTSIGGGCINEAFSVTTDKGHSYFIKSNRNVGEDFFQLESTGLARLADADAIRVPAVIGLGQAGSTQFLVLEFIRSGTPRKGFQEELGRGLASIHRSATQQHFGLETDNILGRTPQPNNLTSNWVEFWAEQRLGFQLRLAANQGLANDQLLRSGRKLIERLDSLISFPDEPPALIHGDLWSGNFMCDSEGHPVLIDPAVYFARREAEFGMTTLFGGFDQEFYAGYYEVWPLAEGHAERIEVYRLYHLLNHLNLFGNSYLNGCLEILEKYV